jgi:serine phosphatase RsbU (regulator of sigma subunit)
MEHLRRPLISTLSTTRRNRGSRSHFWNALPLGAHINFYSGVFALFASIGFISLGMRSWYFTPVHMLITVLIMGGFAVGYAAVSMARRFWLIPVLGISQGFLFEVVDSRYYNHALRLLPPGDPLERQLSVIGVGSILSVVTGYVLFVAFISQQGSRLFRAQTEIALAGEIHRALVPAIQRSWGNFEVYGASIPSGEVGGDLVDVVGSTDAWTAYIADVSGHGVYAGLLMAMFKTAVRTCAEAESPDLLLQGVHRALYPLKTSNTFVTAGFLQYRQGTPLLLSLAGHPALLRYNSRTRYVEECGSAGMPVGILPEQSFHSVSVSCEPQDLLLLLTDGLAEVFDKDGKELGIEPIKHALANAATLPLLELFTSLRQVALNAGRQEDDQTMLLVRRLA